VACEHEGALFSSLSQQRVQIRCGLDSVLRVGKVVAPSLPGPVIGAHPGGGVDGANDSRPVRRELAEPTLQDHGGTAGPGAIQVELVTTNVV
jgi:hypothetical protein